MTICGAAKKYGISYSAMAVHVKNKSKPPKNGQTLYDNNVLILVMIMPS